MTSFVGIMIFNQELQQSFNPDVSFMDFSTDYLWKYLFSAAWCVIHTYHNALLTLWITAQHRLQDLAVLRAKRNAGEDLLLPVGWQHSLGFVVASQPMDPALDQNQAELGIFVLGNKVTLQPQHHNYLDFSTHNSEEFQ